MIELAPQPQRESAASLMVLINGVQNAAVAALDRGLGYGDGVFRTLPARGGRPQQWTRHYAKLAADCAAIGIRCPSADALARDLAYVCRSARDCSIKIIITRGVGSRGYAHASDLEPTRIVIGGPVPDYPESYTTTGVRVRRCTLRLSAQPALAGIKHLNRLENVLARAEWDDFSIAEGLLTDTQGNVVGGTMTNVFIAKAGVLHTPRLDTCGVAGVTRERIIEAARKKGVGCEINSLNWDDMLDADEIVLVNSLAGAWPVRELDGEARQVGALTRSMQHWLTQDG